MDSEYFAWTLYIFVSFLFMFVGYKFDSLKKNYNKLTDMLKDEIDFRKELTNENEQLKRQLHEKEVELLRLRRMEARAKEQGVEWAGRLAEWMHNSPDGFLNAFDDRYQKLLNDQDKEESKERAIGVIDCWKLGGNTTATVRFKENKK